MQQKNVTIYDVIFREVWILYSCKFCPVIDVKWPVKLEINTESMLGIKYQTSMCKKNMYYIQLVSFWKNCCQTNRSRSLNESMYLLPTIIWLTVLDLRYLYSLTFSIKFAYSYNFIWRWPKGVYKLCMENWIKCLFYFFINKY